MFEALPDEILHNIGRFVIENERTSNASSQLSATYFYFCMLGQLNWTFYERMHDPSFWEHDVFSIVLRDNKTEEDEHDEADNSLCAHMLELMKHCQFRNIIVVAYKHSSFVYNLIYKGIVNYPEICDNLCSLHINSYKLPPLEGLLPVLSKCAKLEEFSLKFYDVSRSRSNFDTTKLESTLLEAIVIDCGNYSKHEFVETLIRASPHLKHFGFKSSLLVSSTIKSLSSCSQLQVLDIQCYTFNVEQDTLLEFIQSTKLKQFIWNTSEIRNTPQYCVIEEITKSWCDSLERLSLLCTDVLFVSDENLLPLTPCPLLHHFEFIVDARYNYSGTTKDFFWLAEFLTSACTTTLRTLRLAKVHFLNSKVTQNFTCLRNLKSLECAATLTDDDPLIAFVEIAGESLEKLTATKRWSETEYINLERVVDYCPNLREIGPAYVKDLQILSSFPKLNTLHAIFEHQNDIKCNKLNNLRHLKILIYNTNSFNPKPVYALLDNIPNLYSLQIVWLERYHSTLRFPLDTIEIANRCPHLKVLELYERTFILPSHTNFRSLAKLSNGSELYSWRGQKLQPTIAWMISCTDLSNFKLDTFIEEVKLKEYLEARLTELEQDTDAEMMWKLFVAALEELSSDIVGKYIFGDSGQELVEQFLKFVREQETKYKAREKHVMPVGERGWDLTVPQFYDMVYELYPQLIQNAFNFL